MNHTSLEASQLGWKKGSWPKFFTHVGVLYFRGRVAPGIDCVQEDMYFYHTPDHQSDLLVNGDHFTPKEMGWKPREWPKSFVAEEPYEEYFRIARIEHDTGPNSTEPRIFDGYEYITRQGDLMKVYHG